MCKGIEGIKLKAATEGFSPRLLVDFCVEFYQFFNTARPTVNALWRQKWLQEEKLQHVKDPGHSAKNVGVRLQLKARASYVSGFA